MAKKKRKTASEQPIQKEAVVSNRLGFSPLVKTCVLFAVILMALHAFTWAFALKGWINWGYGTAHIVSSILSATGIQNIVDGNIITLRNDTWNVTSECTAVNAVFLFISFVLAYTSTVRSKTIGLLAGVPLIITVNITRLVVLGWVTEYWPKQAKLFHDYIWQTVFVFFIIALWFVWINLVVNREKATAVSA